MVQLRRDAAIVGGEGYIRPETITPGMFGYSLLRAGQNRDFFKALMVEMAAFGVPIEGLHTETGPGVYEAAILFSEALEQADRAICSRPVPRRSARASASCELHGQVERAVSRLFRAHPPESFRRQEESVPRREEQERHEQALRELPRRAGDGPYGIRADVLADDQQLQAPGRRLLAPVKPTWVSTTARRASG